MLEWNQQQQPKRSPRKEKKIKYFDIDDEVCLLLTQNIHGVVVTTRKLHDFSRVSVWT